MDRLEVEGGVGVGLRETDRQTDRQVFSWIGFPSKTENQKGCEHSWMRKEGGGVEVEECKVEGWRSRGWKSVRWLEEWGGDSCSPWLHQTLVEAATGCTPSRARLIGQC